MLRDTSLPPPQTNKWTHRHIYIYICVCMRVCVCVHARADACLFVCISVCVGGCPGYDIKLHLLEKFKFWSAWMYGVTLCCHYSHVAITVRVIIMTQNTCLKTISIRLEYLKPYKCTQRNYHYQIKKSLGTIVYKKKTL